MIKKILNGVVHTVPRDLRQVLVAHTKMVDIWNNITPLARNEWICWITSAQKSETRIRRIRILFDKLTKGERRPCCWVGCPHR